jgi:thiol:disulfide interchange protein DsbD
MTRTTSSCVAALIFTATIAHVSVLADTQERVPARAVQTDQATVELIAARRSHPGSEVWIGLRFRLRDKWHIYWKNPGDSGGPPTVTWRLPPGVTAGEFQWPAPSRLPLGPLMNYGYEGDVVLPVRLTLDERSRVASSLLIQADVRWLVCREVCLSAKGTLALALSSTPSAEDAEWSKHIAAARDAVPKSAPATWRANAASEKEHFVLTVSMSEPAASAYFFPLVESQIDDSTPQTVTTRGRSIQLRLRKSDQLTKDPLALKGVITLASGASFELTAPVRPSSQRGR